MFAIIARDDDFADALTASYIAGQLHAPILLVKTHGPIAQETLDALRVRGVTDVDHHGRRQRRRCRRCGATRRLDVVQLRRSGSPYSRGAIRTINIQRVQGPTRFGTAASASRFTFGGNTIGFLDPNEPGGPAHPLRTAILANGRNFPDAMVGGPLAYQG